jgi:hypothetical protein
MTARELRIGNTVYDVINKMNIYIRPEIISDFYNDYISLKPIELSNELLLKFGFNKIGFKFIKDGIELFPVRDLYYRGNFPIKSDIKYVHQLQNLYFALTGSELQYVA